jgi:hypothetical protein
MPMKGEMDVVLPELLKHGAHGGRPEGALRVQAVQAKGSGGGRRRCKRAQMWLAELQTLPDCCCVSAEALEERRLAKRALTGLA